MEGIKVFMIVSYLGNLKFEEVDGAGLLVGKIYGGSIVNICIYIYSYTLLMLSTFILKVDLAL